MTKTKHEQTVQPEDSRHSAIIELGSEQTRQILEVLANPPAANEALQELMVRTPPWKTAKV